MPGRVKRSGNGSDGGEWGGEHPEIVFALEAAETTAHGMVERETLIPTGEVITV